MYDNWKEDRRWKDVYTTLMDRLKSKDQDLILFILASLDIPIPIPSVRLTSLKHLTHHFISNDIGKQGALHLVEHYANKFNEDEEFPD